MPKTIDSKAIIKTIDASPMSFNGVVLDKQGFSEHSVVRDVHKIGKFIQRCQANPEVSKILKNM